VDFFINHYNLVIQRRLRVLTEIMDNDVEKPVSHFHACQMISKLYFQQALKVGMTYLILYPPHISKILII